MDKKQARLTNRGAAGLLVKLDENIEKKVVVPELPTSRSINRFAKDLLPLVRDISLFLYDPENARLHPERNKESIIQSLVMYGQCKPIVVRKDKMIVVAGNGTLEAARELGWTKIAVVIEDMDDITAAGYGVADNRTAELAAWNFEVLAKIQKLQLDAGQPLPGWTQDELEAQRRQYWEPEPVTEVEEEVSLAGNLSNRFIVPPFSILDARQGYWQERKKAWLSLGIQSELGRGLNLQPMAATDLGPSLNNYGDDKKLSAAPGGSLMPMDRAKNLATARAATPGGNHRSSMKQDKDGITSRGDGRGKKVPTAVETLSGGPGSLGKGFKSKSTYNDRESIRDHGLKGLAQDAHIKKGKAIPGGGTGKNSAYMFKTEGGDSPLKDIQQEGEDVVQSGTSIFDPVLCELIYRWFCPPNGTIFDPFAGGSVRGIVASKLGRAYVGIDLRPEQAEANNAQAEKICTDTVTGDVCPDYQPDLTPIERVGGVWLKRDDLYCVAGVRGGKVRTCWHLSQGATGLVTAGSRASPQVNIVAHMAKRLEVPCRVHTPEGELSPEVQDAKANGAKVVQHKAGYNNVIIARAREDAEERSYANIPFGMECEEAIEQTRQQVRDLPEGVARIVVPVGSGMSLAGILWGLVDIGLDVPVLGVCVGANPEKRLDKYAPDNWRDMVTLIESGSDYHQPYPLDECQWGDIELDPYYEAKCQPYLEEDDLFWLVGIRATSVKGVKEAIKPTWLVGDSIDIPELVDGESQWDMVFSCPPYADLEVYSDDPRDLSTMSYEDFLEHYRWIIQCSVSQLKDNRFACFVVGEVRNKESGAYHNFVADTIQAFRDAGMEYYNECILITAVGSLPIRVGYQFESSRKIGKTHQNVLVFVKGDPKIAAREIGIIEMGDADNLIEEAQWQEALMSGKKAERRLF